MSDLALELRNGQTSYRPGEQVAGRARWWFENPPGKIEIQLVWFTRGKGDVDTQIVDAMILEEPEARGDRAFVFTIPPSPYSFSGKLISLMWCIKAIAKRPSHESQANIVVSPTGGEILLYGQ